MDVPRPPNLKINDTEFGLLHRAALFINCPQETIDHDPSRTFDPITMQEIPNWRKNYKTYLAETNPPTIEDDFFEANVYPFQEKYVLPSFTEDKYSSRLVYVIDIFRAYDKAGPIFGKCPKWLNDFSGYTVSLLDTLFSAGIDIRGIFLYREPLNTLASTLERKFRLHEVFEGDVERYAEYVHDSLVYSTRIGLDMAKQYNFYQLQYEAIQDKFPDLMHFLEVKEYSSPKYRNKYGRRFVLNPTARSYYHPLKPIGETLGYKYRNQITFSLYIWELCKAIIRTTNGIKNNVNNPETPLTIVKRCFWYEVNTPKAGPARAMYRKIRRQFKLITS